MRDEDEREMHLAGELREEIDDLRLDGNVESADRFVRDNELRLDRERAGDGDALALAAGEFVGILFDEPRCEPDLLHQFAHAPRQLAGGNLLVRLNRLGQRVVNGHARIQRGVGILEDHLEVRPRLTQFRALQLLQMLSRQHHRALGRRDELHDGATERGLAAAGFAHEAENLALVQRQGNAVHRAHRTNAPADEDPALHRKVGLHVAQFEESATHNFNPSFCTRTQALA